MIDYGKVRSSVEPKPIEITDTKVFLASNIVPYEEEFDDKVVKGFEYEYKSFNKNEYIQYIGEQNKDLQEQLLQTQLALCDIYEAMGGDM